MSAEVKTGKIYIQTRSSKGLKRDFKKHCKSLNVSMAQRLRDLIQDDLKSKEYKKFLNDGPVGQTDKKSA